jgi:ComF family protein
MLGKILSPSLSLFRPLYEFVYPPTCLVCENHPAEDERKICVACWSSIRQLSSDDELYREKLNELKSRGNVAGFASAFHFEKDGTLQKLVHHLKYDDMPSIGVELGKFVAASIPTMIDSTTPICALVPVPLHPTKERERGYNQSEHICRGISKANGAQVLPHLLKRTRHTQTQTTLDARERKENVADAFALNTRFASLVRGANFIIVDDIITTGATIDECARVLKAHGTEKVFAVSVAVPDHTHLP